LWAAEQKAKADANPPEFSVKGVLNTDLVKKYLHLCSNTSLDYTYKIVGEMLVYFHTKYPKIFVDRIGYGDHGYGFEKLISSSVVYQNDMDNFFSSKRTDQDKAMYEMPFWKQLSEYGYIRVFEKNGEKISIFCSVSPTQICEYFHNNYNCPNNGWYDHELLHMFHVNPSYQRELDDYIRTLADNKRKANSVC